MSLYDHDAAVRKKQKARQLHTQMLLETFLDKCIEVREKKKVMIEAKKVQKEVDKVKKDIADLYIDTVKTTFSNNKLDITEKRTFGHTEKESNSYCLAVNFPKKYNTYNYQNLIQVLN